MMQGKPQSCVLMLNFMILGILIKTLDGFIIFNMVASHSFGTESYRLTSTMTASPNPKPQAGMSSAPKVENK